MFGRIVFHLLLLALNSKEVQSIATEVSKYAAKRATAYLKSKLQPSAKTYKD